MISTCIHMSMMDVCIYTHCILTNRKCICVASTFDLLSSQAAMEITGRTAWNLNLNMDCFVLVPLIGILLLLYYIIPAKY